MRSSMEKRPVVRGLEVGFVVEVTRNRGAGREKMRKGKLMDTEHQPRRSPWRLNGRWKLESNPALCK